MRFHETIHGVYFDDLDAFHILHNARYLLLFEHAIGSFWRRLGWAGVLDFNTNPDQYHLVRANSLDYQRPVIGTGQVRVRVWVERLGRTSLTFGLRVMPLDEDIEHATGRRTVVRVDPETKRPCAWTPTFRAEIAPYCAHIEAEAGQ
ncbi:thioesterase family protein [Nannocystis sp. ILAH1]|uniref:acyl-CoA thioesterase n=1 Tax=unclassified Nannocystis TaxID=2627009 RepID=UPI00226E0B65|nr:MULTISPECIES: thioesterase family protein [unclassified Nannocystis]MCY0993919.1 thioesterase family protein [Nannocystis sp. ILAH1]MCY1066886.1 thioesterase family protein [Nannocystis sp. RBIL2]